jgi:D-glycero-D-manno-heptose 1,7-bisphosphate phosphatase
MRAIFLDRDGVICENRSNHIKNWQEFRFLPGVKESVAALSRLGLPIIVITNQAVIGRRLVSAEVVEDIHQRMVHQLAAYGGRIDRIVYCPHHPKDNCDCRKPKPGMLWQVAKEMDIDLTRSYLIGDAVADLIAGERVGCQTFLVLTGRGFQQLLPALRSIDGHFTISRNLMRATHHILKAELSIADEMDQSSVAYTKRYHQSLSLASTF